MSQFFVLTFCDGSASCLMHHATPCHSITPKYNSPPQFCCPKAASTIHLNVGAHRTQAEYQPECEMESCLRIFTIPPAHRELRQNTAVESVKQGSYFPFYFLFLEILGSYLIPIVSLKTLICKIGWGPSETTHQNPFNHKTRSPRPQVPRSHTLNPKPPTPKLVFARIGRRCS